MFVYLDNSSTTRQYDAVTEKMLRFMREDFGNPSSLHNMGMAAENALKSARKNVAKALGCGEEEVFFTSGGTEADNLALFGAASARKRRGNKIITSAVEHPAVLESCKRLEQMGFAVARVGVDEKCRFDIKEFYENIDEDTILVSVMHVNNETGTIMPVEEIQRSIKGRAVFHTDAVQSFGKLPLDTVKAGIATVSAHKIHGPKGCGAIAVRKGASIEPCAFGGGQEKNLRPGTENVAAIAGFGMAADIAYTNLSGRAEKMRRARQHLLDGIKAEINDVRINSVEEASLAGEAGFCSPSVLNVSFLGTRGEVILHGLEREKIYVSTGAACSSNKKGGSRTLAAMGLTDREMQGALRFSFSEFNTVDEMDYVLLKLKSEVDRFRKLGSFR
ncbi:MAG: cysteine desulfurase [Clostridiales bacterium]|nr:cysteine desulfurase [Clostridiales bacterium]